MRRGGRSQGRGAPISGSDLQKRYDFQRAPEQLGGKVNAIPTLELGE